jgi:hypothetical protein
VLSPLPENAPSCCVAAVFSTEIMKNGDRVVLFEWRVEIWDRKVDEWSMRVGIYNNRARKWGKRVDKWESPY